MPRRCSADLSRRSAITLLGVGVGLLAGWRGTASAALAESTPNLDMKIYVLQNAEIVAEGAAVIKDPTQPIGSNIFVWQGGDTHGSTWEGMGFQAGPSVPTAPDTDVLQRIDGAPDDGCDQGSHQAGDGAGHHRSIGVARDA